MGIFDFLKGNKSSEPRETLGELPRIGRSRAAAKNIYSGGHYEDVEIVGESHYKESFKRIRDHLGLKSQGETRLDVVLKNDPNNSNAIGGKAVAVFILGEKVGHVSSLTSTAVFDMLEREGGQRKLKGRIYFGDLRESIPKNSVSIDLRVQTKSAEETEKSNERYEKAIAKREVAENVKNEFLRTPIWSTHQLQDGDAVTFTGFSQHAELPRLASILLPSVPSSGIHLLVIHPRMKDDSAKLRDWLSRGRPVTDLDTFLENNPNFSRYFNRDTGEFDMPEEVTGKKKSKPEPPKATRTFESDTMYGDREMPSDIVLLPEQTLARMPTWTPYGSFVWRLSDLKTYKDSILSLFEEVGGQRTDGVLLRGKLVETVLDGEKRLAFTFRNESLALVPKNETQGFLRDNPNGKPKSWKVNPTIALFALDFKGNLKADHDAGLP